ncbi:MAG: hypothetical protein EPN93_13335 [Spirochaetes bacterium]|nr:MAG: hypothetical protein EPN93_13335 [Spirochaetota bacterium]
MKARIIGRTTLAILFITGTALSAGPEGFPDRPFTAIEKSDSGFDSPLHPSEFKNFPRATYRTLLNDYEFLAGEKFYGAVHAEKFTVLPTWFFGPHDARPQVLFAYTRNQKYPLFIILNEGFSRGVADALETREVLHLIYTPAGVYKDIPVVRLLNEYHTPGPRREEKATPSVSTLPEIMKYYPVKPGMKWTVTIGNNVRMMDYEITNVETQWAIGTKRETVPSNPALGKQGTFTIQFDEGRISSVEEFPDASGMPVKKRETILQGPLKAGTRWEIIVDQEKRQREIVGINDTVSVNGKEYKDVIVVREEAQNPDPGINFFAITYLFYAKDTGFIGCKVDTSDSRDKLRTYTKIDEWYMVRSDHVQK